MTLHLTGIYDGPGGAEIEYEMGDWENLSTHNERTDNHRFLYQVWLYEHDVHMGRPRSAVQPISSLDRVLVQEWEHD